MLMRNEIVLSESDVKKMILECVADDYDVCEADLDSVKFFIGEDQKITATISNTSEKTYGS